MALVLARQTRAGDEVGERLLREGGREAVRRPLGGDEGGHERAGQHEVRDPERGEERLREPPDVDHAAVAIERLQRLEWVALVPELAD